MKFKIGDKVKVRGDLVVGRSYGIHLTFVNEMVKYMNRELEIVEIDDDATYRLSSSPFWWNDNMLEPIVVKCCDTCNRGSCTIGTDPATFYCSDYKVKETKKDYWIWAYEDESGCWRQTLYFYDDDFNSNVGHTAACGILDSKKRKKLEHTKITMGGNNVST